jgi:hypothetical protein
MDHDQHEVPDEPESPRPVRLPGEPVETRGMPRDGGALVSNVVSNQPRIPDS